MSRRLSFEDFKLLMLNARSSAGIDAAIAEYVRRSWCRHSPKAPSSSRLFTILAVGRCRRGLKRSNSDITDQLRYPNSAVIREASTAQRRAALSSTRGARGTICEQASIAQWASGSTIFAEQGRRRSMTISRTASRASTATVRS